MKNKYLIGDLFAKNDKPQILKISMSKSKQIITPEKHIQSSFIAWRNIHKRLNSWKFHFLISKGKSPHRLKSGAESGCLIISEPSKSASDLTVKYFKNKAYCSAQSAGTSELSAKAVQA